ncbi:MAG: MFS transporter [Acidobacteria bacterium]|nr:MAG: MFS transporter [Acidobacteriota bacterium]
MSLRSLLRGRGVSIQLATKRRVTQPPLTRYLVVFGLFILSLITYIDRVCISSAKGPIAADLVLSDQAMGLAFSAFALGYALAQVPSGWLADRYGPRLALAGIVSAWSLLTAMTGAVRSLTQLLVVRFFFGMAEAGAFPGSARTFYNWLSAGERGRANGILFSGSRIGAALAFPLLAWMLERFEWRMSFAWLGALGLAWAAAWVLFFRDYPKGVEPRIARDREKSELHAPSIAKRDVMLAMGQYFASNFTFFICLSWMLPFLQEHYRLSPSSAASYAMIPLLGGACALWVAGFSIDFLFKTRLRGWSRRLPAITGFALAAAGMGAIRFAESPAEAVACFAIATFGADLSLSPSWVFCLDIGGRKAGAVSGSMNMAGNIGSFVSANAFPWLYGLTGSANTYFGVAGLLNLAAVACWVGMPLRAPRTNTD